jgi:hypothetical protein
MLQSEEMYRLTPVDLAKKSASIAIHKLHDIMRANVKPRMKNEGVLSAARFCANKSLKEIKKLSGELGKDISIKRISLFNRNPDSYPKESEIGILKAFTLIERADAYLPKQIVQLVTEDTYKVYSASTMSSRTCKKCHGPKEKVNPEVQKLFEDKYPEDKAYGFKSGQVRGAVIITVKIHNKDKDNE